MSPKEHPPEAYKHTHAEGKQETDQQTDRQTEAQRDRQNTRAREKWHGVSFGCGIRKEDKFMFSESGRAYFQEK